MKLFGWKDEKGSKHPGKIEFIKNNIGPLIKKISLDYRVNLWQILIQPLFIPIALFSTFLADTYKELMERKLKRVSSGLWD